MEKKKRKFQVPHVYALLVGLIILCAILTYIIPAGAYDMMTLEDGREVVNPETFHYIEQTPVGLMGTMSAVFRGMLEASGNRILILSLALVLALSEKPERLRLAWSRRQRRLQAK